MDLLLDTHVLLWSLADDERLGRASTLIRDRRNRVYVSTASAWEIAIKAGLGKLRVPSNVASWLPDQLVLAQFTPLPIALAHALAVESLPRHHADPFDRLLVAQAKQEKLVLVSDDQQLERYDVHVVRC